MTNSAKEASKTIHMSSGPEMLFGAIIPISLIVGMFFVVYYIYQNQMKTLSAYFEKLARELRLKSYAPQAPWYKMSYPVIEGDYEGRNIKITTEVHGYGKNRRYYTTIDLSSTNTRHSLQLSKEYWVSGIGKAFGMQDIQINDDFFDKKFIIKSDDENFARRFFNGEMKRTLMDIHPRLDGHISVRPHHINFKQMYRINSSRRLELTKDMIDTMMRIANRVEDI